MVRSVLHELCEQFRVSQELARSTRNILTRMVLIVGICKHIQENRLLEPPGILTVIILEAILVKHLYLNKI